MPVFAIYFLISPYQSIQHNPELLFPKKAKSVSVLESVQM